MKYFIHKEYRELESWIHDIPFQKVEEDHVFCENRNRVVLTHYQGKAMVIKKYKRPLLFNRIVYSFIRKSKPERAYFNALRLQKVGIKTASPIAFIIEKKYGLYDIGWFVSEYIEAPTLKEICAEVPLEKLKKLSSDFAMFSHDVFKKGIIDKDFNSSNIMVSKESGKYQFSLIDVNRIKWGKSNLAEQMRTMERLDLRPMEMTVFLSMYAQLCETDLDKCYFFTYLFKIKRKSIIKGKEWVKAHLHFQKICSMLKLFAW